LFSYRHGFHAGNHADVLKHCVLVQLLAYMAAKEKGFSFVDTHAGAGSYSLGSDFARKKSEFETGIGRLWKAGSKLPAALNAYLAQVRALNRDGRLHFYPGSPQLALQMTRPRDRLHFFELHTTESKALRKFAASAPRASAHAADGFARLKGLLPPPSRRALVLIDPSYEDKEDYRKVVGVMRDALKRFATGVYAVWYPMVRRSEPARLADELQTLAPGDWLHASLRVGPPPRDGLGLYGSGVFVFNPPWKLEAALAQALPVLARLLGKDGRGAYALKFRQT
jgi:23S rRNA (adenine2030-N6)-methyltransferase